MVLYLTHQSIKFLVANRMAQRIYVRHCFVPRSDDVTSQIIKINKQVAINQ